jgi:hypothetical protein
MNARRILKRRVLICMVDLLQEEYTVQRSRFVLVYTAS